MRNVRKWKERHNSAGHSGEFFKRIKTLTGKFNPRLGTIKSKEGKILTERDEIKTDGKNTHMGYTNAIRPYMMNSQLKNLYQNLKLHQRKSKQLSKL